MACLFVFREHNQLEQCPERGETPSASDLKMLNLYDPLFNGVERIGKLLETGPVGSGFRFLDVDINGVAKVTRPIYEHEGHLCVAPEGHDIATHDLDQVFDGLCGRVTLGGGLGERIEQESRRNRCAVTRARVAARAARLKERLGGSGARRFGTRRGWWCFTIRHLNVAVGVESWGEKGR